MNGLCNLMGTMNRDAAHGRDYGSRAARLYIPPDYNPQNIGIVEDQHPAKQETEVWWGDRNRSMSSMGDFVGALFRLWATSRGRGRPWIMLPVHMGLAWVG